jgi:hypothetical protein
MCVCVQRMSGAPFVILLSPVVIHLDRSLIPLVEPFWIKRSPNDAACVPMRKVDDTRFAPVTVSWAGISA